MAEHIKAMLAADIHGEIAHIEQQLQQKREQLRTMQESGEITEVPHEKETLRSVVQEKINEHAPVQTTPTDDTSDDDEDDDQQTPPPPEAETPSYLQPELQEQVQHFVNSAFNDSISVATKKARETRNPALFDAFHDALVDQLFEHLVERGRLKKM